MNSNNLLAMYDAIITNGGASYQIETGQLNPTTGFMVALPGYEQTFSIPDNVNQWQNIVLSYLLTKVQANNEKHCTIVGLLVENIDYFLGAWIDSGKLYLDLSENVADFETAKKLGIERKQISIYNCVNNEVYFL